MKKVLLCSLIAVAIFIGCTEEKKAPITETTTQEVKKDDASRTSQTPVATEEKKEETK
ncbi:MAG: hypothetical protein KA418_05375 [Leptotrichiaceae bacterium]|jgi:hypothetical protein|nr:hypothetical protein [Leptotrichiaceae bacterium]MBP9616124.1 hypothetical protein [Aliarcobacter sp.]MBU9918513.1 hypothetical protein [Fusobacteriaceae bacterium]